jgi:hypothetical protein
MNKVSLAALVVLWLAHQHACAGSLRIVGDEVTCSTSQTYFQFVLGLDASGAEPSDNLIGWQLKVRIVPDKDAHGSVGFATDPVSVPPSYVFGGLAGDIAVGELTSSTLVASNDIFELVLGGMPPVTVAQDANLLVITLTCSDAIGRFNIEVVAESDADSMWYSADLADPTDPDKWTSMPFVVKPIAGQLPSVVESVVFVPEPSGLVLFLSGVTVLAIGWARGHRRKVTAQSPGSLNVGLP